MFEVIIIITILNVLFWVFIFSTLLFNNNYCTNIEQNVDNIQNTAVVLAIKNEEINLKNNFNSIFSQKPHGFKVVIVDDYSTDNGLDYLEKHYKKSIIKVFKNLDSNGKKQAITYALNNIEQEYIVFTDADCYVTSDSWVKKMTDKFDDKIEIVLGYSPYTGKRFLDLFIRFETFMAALQYFSYSLIGIPYMGVGRNMAIKKSFFFKNGGYKSHIDLKSGNDDLFVNENANSNNTAIQIDPDTFVYTTPSETIGGFIRQKTRHVSTSFRYKTIHKILLGLYSFSHISFYLSLIVGSFFIPLSTVFYIWFVRLVIVLLSSFGSFIKLKEKDLLLLFPILDFLMFIYYTFMGIYYFFAPKNKW